MTSMGSYSPEEYTVASEGFASTTDATVTTIDTINVPTGRLFHVKTTVVGKRTGGASGTDGDCASYYMTATYKNVAGTVSIVGALDVVANEDQVGWDATQTISGTNVLVTVTGASGNNVSWSSRSEIVKVGNT